MLKVIVCGYRCEDTLKKCLSSIDMQTYQHFARIVSIDEDSKRKYLLRNTIDATDALDIEPEDIVVLIDADDFLCDETAFQTVVNEYSENPDLLLTYGSYANLSSNKAGKFCGPYLPGESFRTSQWRGSHLKTFKYKLLLSVPEEEFKDQNGEYFKCCADRALMIPMMELAGHDRIRHIPLITYCYNDVNPNSVWSTMKVLSKINRAYIAGKPALLRKKF